MARTNPETRRRWYAEHAEEQREKKRAWMAANPEARKRNTEYGKKWREENTERLREWRRERVLAQYNLTLEDYDTILDAQLSRCAICGADEPGGRHQTWHVDHCHDTGEVRGLLCTKCNMGLGHFDDDPAVLRQALDYLTNARKWKKKR